MEMKFNSDGDFEKFFKEFYPAVYAFLVRYTGDSELASNLAQDTFLHVYEEREKIGTIEYAKAFLYTTARFLYWNYCKHERAHENYLEYLSESREEDYNFLEEITREETECFIKQLTSFLPEHVK